MIIVIIITLKKKDKIKNQGLNRNVRVQSNRYIYMNNQENNQTKNQSNSR